LSNLTSNPQKREPRRSAKAVVMGASAGALDALSAIIPRLPADFPIPVLVVVHLPADRKSILAELLQTKSKITVREAEEKELIEPGTVFLAPPDYHLLVDWDFRLALSSEEPVHFSRPSIDVLFETAADVYGSDLIGVILTGASDDGARGLKEICKAGGIAVVQDPLEATSPVMPQSALNACPSAHVLKVRDIADFLKEFAASK